METCSYIFSYKSVILMLLNKCSVLTIVNNSNQIYVEWIYCQSNLQQLYIWRYPI